MKHVVAELGAAPGLTLLYLDILHPRFPGLHLFPLCIYVTFNSFFFLSINEESLFIGHNNQSRWNLFPQILHNGSIERHQELITGVNLLHLHIWKMITLSDLHCIHGTVHVWILQHDAKPTQ